MSKRKSFAVDYHEKRIINLNTDNLRDAYNNFDKFETWEIARNKLVIYYVDLIEKSKDDISEILDLKP